MHAIELHGFQSYFTGRRPARSGSAKSNRRASYDETYQRDGKRVKRFGRVLADNISYTVTQWLSVSRKGYLSTCFAKWRNAPGRSVSNFYMPTFFFSSNLSFGVRATSASSDSQNVARQHG